MTRRLACFVFTLAATLQGQEAGTVPVLHGGPRPDLTWPGLTFRAGGTFLTFLEIQGFHEVQRGAGPATHRSVFDLSYFPMQWLGVRVALEGDNAGAAQAIPERPGPVRDRTGGGVGIIIRF